MDSNYEHWLTVWKCNNCEQIPETAPLYRCKLGHTFCNTCFDDATKSCHEGEKYTCKLCGSEEFEIYNPSPGFLKKLKVKPGIGRPYRYINNELHPETTVFPCSDDDDYSRNEQSTVTIENLFRLPSEKIQMLFNDKKQSKSYTQKQKIYQETKNRKVENFTNDLESNMFTNSWLTKTKQILPKNINSNSFIQSKKPLRCPHDPCRKVVAISNFNSHFKYEHPQIERFSVERGKELLINCDASIIEHNLTFCLAIITIYEINKLNSSSKSTQGVVNACNKLSQKVPINTFWLMVSGSPNERHSTAYALYWLFTNNDDFYNCTFEMSSINETTCCSTLCGVNGIHDSQEITEIAQRLNCLYLSRGSIQSFLEEGPCLKLRVTIH